MRSRTRRMAVTLAMVLFAFNPQRVQSQPIPTRAACRGVAAVIHGTAHVAREGDHFVIDVEVVLAAERHDVVFGPSISGAYGVDRLVRATVNGNVVHVRFIPGRDFTSSQIDIPTRCATGSQMTVASVITGMLSRVTSFPMELQVEMGER